MITPAAAPHVLPTAHPRPSFYVGAILIGGIGVPAWPEPAISPFAGMVAMLRAELRLRGHDDAVVVLGVLEKALRRDHVAGRESIACERHILLGDMRRRPADFHVGTVRFVVPRQWILGLAATAAAPAILLSLPHRLRFNPDKRLSRDFFPARRFLVCSDLQSKFAIHLTFRPPRGHMARTAIGKCISAAALR